MNQGKGFDLYLLMGQSNMAGRGVVEAEDLSPHPRVFALNKEGEWLPAIDPIHFDKPGLIGVGPGTAFGKHMAAWATEARIGLVPCAAGGSPISSWQQGGYWQQTQSHPYDDMIARAQHGMEKGILRGAIWHQGESDSNPTDAPLYAERLHDLVRRLRHSLGAPELAFVVGTLGDAFVARHPEAELINEALRQLPQEIGRTACVEASGLGHKGDDLHFSASASRELGRRYAQAMIRLLSD